MKYATYHSLAKIAALAQVPVVNGSRSTLRPFRVTVRLVVRERGGSVESGANLEIRANILVKYRTLDTRWNPAAVQDTYGAPLRNRTSCWPTLKFLLENEFYKNFVRTARVPNPILGEIFPRDS